MWNFKYFNGTTIKSFSICVNSNITHEQHYNKSKLNKDEGYNIINNKINELKKEFNDSKIIDIKLIDYIKLSNYNKRSLYQINNYNNINWNKKNVDIDPYILGCWLGDGDMYGKGFTSPDIEVIKSFVNFTDKINCDVTHHKSYNHDGYHYSIRRKNTGFLNSVGSIDNSYDKCEGCQSSTSYINPDICNWTNNIYCNNVNNSSYINMLIDKCDKYNLNPFTQLLKDKNLYKNKYIPDEYIYNDKQTRLELLAGLIDTDGRIINNNTNCVSIEFCQSDRLHRNIVKKAEFIANSLGFSTSIYETNNNKYTKNGLSMKLLTLRIFGNNLYEIPTRVERKKIIYSGIRSSLTKHYTKFDVKYLGKDKFCGWQLDGNERFLLSNFTVTHNSRLLGGKDHASSRYIFTELNKLVKYLFNENDIPLLENNYDDGQKIEPIFYTPIIPMILVNGTEGIGTGYSTAVPTYNPTDIINNIRNMLNNEDINEMKPWSMGYSGSIIKLDTNKYMSRGIYKFLDFNTVEVTELPLGVWTDAYKDEIESKYIFDEKSNKTGFLIGYENHSTESTVKFILKFRPGMLTSLRTNIEKFEKMLHLYAPITSTNMHLYNEKEKITKYDTINDIFKAFFNVRLLYYHKRREYLIKKLTRELNIIEYKVKFIEEIINETIYIFKKKKDEVIEILKKNNYPIFNLSADILQENCDSDGNYNYLISMPIHTFTQEKIDELKNQQELKKAEVDNIHSKDEKQLWKNDLDLFEEKYVDFLDNYIENIKNEKCNKVSKKGKKRSKKVGKK
jgi:hypothetical protein